MFDFIQAVREVLDKSAVDSMRAWLSELPKGASWYLVSDYVFDAEERHDTAAFVVLLNHDSLDNIFEYISYHAPVDIKSSRAAAGGLIGYLKSPVVFSFVFVLDDADSFFSTYISVANMLDGIDDLISFAGIVRERSQGAQYFSDVITRLKSLSRKLKSKGNAKIARKLFLVSALASVVMDCLDNLVDPDFISWVSDRDAMLQQHGGVIWDIAILFFLSQKAQRTPRDSLISRPQFLYVEPAISGDNYFDPLIRMADYLAGAASGLNLCTFDYASEKIGFIGRECFETAGNSVLCTISWTGRGFLVRRYRAPELDM